MKCAIICLLAFWAFETIFARHAFKDPDYGNEGTANRFNDALGKFDDPVYAESYDAKWSPEIANLINNCFTEAESHNAFHQKYTASVEKCDQCYDKAKKDKNVKAADTCCDKAVSAFLTVNKLKNDRAMACMKKCEKLGKDCPEMLQKLLPNDTQAVTGLA